MARSAFALESSQAGIAKKYLFQLFGPACLIQQKAKEKAWPSSPRTKMTGCCRR